MSELKEVISKWRQQCVKLREQIIKQKVLIIKQREQFVKLRERFVKLRERISKLREQFIKLTERFGKLREQFLKLREGFVKLREQIIKQKKLISQLRERISKLREQFVKLREQFIKLRECFVFFSRHQGGSVDIRYKSILKAFVSRQSKKSDIGNKSNLGIKTCSANPQSSINAYKEVLRTAYSKGNLTGHLYFYCPSSLCCLLFSSGTETLRGVTEMILLRKKDDCTEILNTHPQIFISVIIISSYSHCHPAHTNTHPHMKIFEYQRLCDMNLFCYENIPFICGGPAHH